MEITLVTDEELIAILNQELHKTENPNNYRFENVIKLADKDGNGCNWSEVFVGAGGIPITPILPIANLIIIEAKKKYNLK